MAGALVVVVVVVVVVRAAGVDWDGDGAGVEMLLRRFVELAKLKLLRVLDGGGGAVVGTPCASTVLSRLKILLVVLLTDPVRVRSTAAAPLAGESELLDALSELAIRLKTPRKADTEASTAVCTPCQPYSRRMKSSIKRSSLSICVMQTWMASATIVVPMIQTVATVSWQWSGWASIKAVAALIIFAMPKSATCFCWDMSTLIFATRQPSSSPRLDLMLS